MIIRTFVPADEPAVIALWQACGLTRPWNDPAKDIAFAMAGPTSTILVGEENGELVASVMVGHDGHRGALYYFSVNPKTQKKGLGRQLHNAAIGWLKQRGVWKVNVLIRAENEAVSSMYETYGYRYQPSLSYGKWLDK